MLASSNYACSAYVVTNAFGSVIAADGSVLKGPAEPEKALATMITSQKPTLLTNTTLAFVVTNVKCDFTILLCSIIFIILFIYYLYIICKLSLQTRPVWPPASAEGGLRWLRPRDSACVHPCGRRCDDCIDHR